MAQLNPNSGNGVVNDLNVRQNLTVKGIVRGDPDPIKLSNTITKDLIIDGELSVTDPAIGTWIGVAPTPTPQYIHLHVLPGGHLQFSSSIDMGAAYFAAPHGGALTPGVGYWKALGNSQYSTRQTQLILDKDLTPGNDYVMIPSSRIVVDSTFTLSNNNQTLTGQYVVNGYAITDYTLSTIIYTVPSRPYTCNKVPGL